ncbi:hypothetical protein YC2023_118027 [Brassica napus]
MRPPRRSELCNVSPRQDDLLVILIKYLNTVSIAIVATMTVLSSTDRSLLSSLFSNATPVSKFPTCTSDYYHFIELLTPEEQAVRKRVREFMEKEVAPIMTEYWEKAEFPFHIIPKLGALGVVGGSIKGYGCPGLSITANAIATAEISRVDASCGTFNLVHTSLDMLTIGMGVDELEQLELQVDTSVRQIRSTTIMEFLGTGDIVRIETTNGWCLPIVEFLGTGEVVRIETTNGWCLPVLNSPLPNNINAVMQVPKDVCTVKKPHNASPFLSDFCASLREVAPGYGSDLEGSLRDVALGRSSRATSLCRSGHVAPGDGDASDLAVSLRSSRSERVSQRLHGVAPVRSLPCTASPMITFITSFELQMHPNVSKNSMWYSNT